MGIWAKLIEKLGLTAEEAEQLKKEIKGDGAPDPKPGPAVDLDRLEKLVHNREAIDLLRSMMAEKDAEAKELRSKLAEAEKKAAAYETDKAERERLMKEQEAKTTKERIEKAIADAIAAGKIPAKNEDLVAHYRSILEANFEAGAKVIEAIPSTTKPATTKPADTHESKNAGTPGKIDLESLTQKAQSELAGSDA